MSDELSQFESLDNFKEAKKPQKGAWLSKSIGCMIVGIASLAIGPWQYGLPGVVCALIAFSYYSHDIKIYRADPHKYERSYKYLRTGLIFAIIGLIVSLIMCYVWWWAIFDVGIYDRPTYYY